MIALAPTEGLGAGISLYMNTLREYGVETFESRQGGHGHAYAEPTVRFHGHRGAGFRALAVAHQRGLPVTALRRAWPIYDGEPTGPCWEIIFQGASS